MAIYDDEQAVEMRRRDEMPFYEPTRRLLGEIFARIRPPGRIDVMDLGCGSGRYFHLFTDCGLYLAIDPSGPALREALKPAFDGLYGKERVEFLEGDISHPDLDSKRFDLIHCVGVYGQLVVFDRSVVRRACSLLSKKGVAMFLVKGRVGDGGLDWRESQITNKGIPNEALIEELEAEHVDYRVSLLDLPSPNAASGLAPFFAVEFSPKR